MQYSLLWLDYMDQRPSVMSRRLNLVRTGDYSLLSVYAGQLGLTGAHVCLLIRRTE